MAKLMGIDYGTKRTGIAVTDDLQIIASGLTTVETKNIWSFLKEYFEKNQVEAVVIGEPLALNGSETDNTKPANKFALDFIKKFPEIKVDRIDESFTSKMAFQTMIASGISKKKRRDKGLVDKISATIILQSYMEMIS